MHILTVITALLQETKVILLTEHPSLLFPCCEVLLSLMYPFQFIHDYRPFIPPCDPSITRYLTSSKPALLGLMSSSITKLPDTFRGMIVRLDSNSVELYRTTVSTLPSKLRLLLFLMILQNADFYLCHQPERENTIALPPEIQRQQLHAIRSPKFKKETARKSSRSSSPSAHSVNGSRRHHQHQPSATPKPSPNRHIGRARSSSATSARSQGGAPHSFPILDTTLSQSETSFVVQSTLFLFVCLYFSDSTILSLLLIISAVQYTTFRPWTHSHAQIEYPVDEGTQITTKDI